MLNLYSRFRAITMMAVVVIVGLCVFGITTTVSAVQETCTWTASTTQLMSLGGNWDNGSGSACTIDPQDILIFDGNVTTTNATWDNDLIGAASVTTQNAYIGTITVNVTTTATTTALTLHTGTFTNNSESRFWVKDFALGDGDLTIDSGATYNGTGGLWVDGSIINAGTFSQTASSTIFLGTDGTETIGTTGNTTFYNLTISSSTVLAGNVTTTNVLTIDASKTLDIATSTVNLSGTSTPFVHAGGTFTNGSGTVSYSNTGSVNIASTTYGNLTLGTGTYTMLANTTVTGTLTNAGTLGGAFTVILSGTGAPLAVGGAFGSGSTVSFTGATANIASTTYKNLTLGTGTYTMLANTTVTGTLTMTAAGTLNAGSYTLTLSGTGTPLVHAGATFNNQTGTVSYTGATASIASTTYSNLTLGTGAYTMLAATTVTGTLTNTGTLSATSTLILSASGTPFVNSGTFTSNSSTVSYSSAGSVTTTGATYWTLTLGSGTYLINDNTTSTNSFTNGGTTTISSGKTLVAPVTFDNNGTITETGAIKHANTSAKLTDSGGTEITLYNVGNTLYVTVVDTDGNLNSGTPNTITGSVVTATDSSSDVESVTLTETGNDTSIFIGSLSINPFTTKTSGNGALETNGSGSLSLAFTDSKDSTDTGSDTATYTGSVLGTGGGTGGSYTPPPSHSIVIDNYASSTTSYTVTLALKSSTAASMLISNNALFTGASWETYKTSKSWTLTDGAGNKTVYAKFKDGSNTLSGVVSDIITLKATTSTPATQTTTTTPATTDPTTPSTPTTDTASPATDTGTSVQTGASDTVPAVKFTKELKYLTTNASVKTLQKELKKMGYFTYPSFTNFYGNATKAAMIKYQKANGLKQTGNLDKATMAVLNGTASVAVEKTPSVPASFIFTKYLAFGYTGNEVKQLQIRLQELGYLSQSITPISNFGPATRAAVIKLQKEHKVTPTAGFVGPATRKVLNGK